MAWELFRRDAAGGLEMIGVDGELLTAAPLTGLPLACEITIDAPSTLPEFIGSAEVSLESVTHQLGGRIAATSRTATRLWTLVHLPSDEHASRFAQLPLPAGASITVAPTVDPGWTIFDRARPVDMEQQSMSDLRVMADLYAAGDVGGVRRVDHAVTDLPGDRIGAFTAAVASIGFTVDASDDGTVVAHHRADPADLTSDSWTVRLIAERHGGTYGGWVCDTIRAEHATKPKKPRRKGWLGRR